ncbi:YbbR-like domain-containing protein [Treponema phagedenis]|uniref:YbbR-like domain-containing protein n=1 Tax=Treponema phagedenis TaxID=162 RepID=A0A0B7GU25_TREPH|nr:CdaR family protein [Treponema phagedenis]EFW37436.1 YbbR-like protein [Treponema phagedenis F0421]NVP24801.1 YbbR-like domain-containing protein [Treponema phagedenis]QEJ95910.1 YbbR-like domain-containing protein [Treponema phagedenis]QEJ98914.1 YbbR-like domain-containing protein [Treponema phagedenis]QEK00393.1 YbbR-like domain-containing protein [Treponema phagedenis]
MNKMSWLESLVHNWPAKILCLALALLLSLFYKGSLQERRYISVPLIIKNQGSELVPATTYPRMIKVSLSGESESIGPIRETDIIASIDISNYKNEGEFKIPIDIQLQGTASNIKPLEVSAEPANIFLKLEYDIERKVPIVLSIKGSPPDGYQISESNISPEFITVKGPSSTVHAYENLNTEEINVNDKTATFSGVANIVNTNPLISVIGNSQIQYNIKIQEVATLKTFETSIINITNVADNLLVSFDPIKISAQIQAPKKLLKMLSPDLFFSLSCKNITEPGTAILPIQINLPAGASVLYYTPKEMQITVTEKTEEKEKSDSGNRD